MATYYVRKSGSDSNAGTSAGAAWLTIGKALGASGIASGDTVYIGAGVYREHVTVAMTSATAETRVVGDVTGQYTGDSGEVRWSAYTTNDKSAPTTRCLTLSGRDYLTFENILFVGGTTSGCCVDGQTSHSTNITLRRCVFIPGNSGSGAAAVAYSSIADTASNWLIDSCWFPSHASSAFSININLTTSASADYDSNFVIKNCVFFGGIGNNNNSGILITANGAGSFKGGGVDIFNCSLVSAAIRFNSANNSTTIPCTIYNSLVIAHGFTALSANTSGQLTENYNVIHAGTARSNVTAGTNSIATNNYALLYSMGHEAMWGMQARPFGAPLDSSPFLGFGAQGGGPSIDMLGGPRPSGGASTSYAVGALERNDCGTKETTTTHAGAAALKITGPGYHDFQVPVDATSTTITVYARYDTNHAATNKPQISVLNGGGCGVSDATATMTAAVDTWEALSLTFTPTSKGIVTIRCISRSAAGNGIAYFDS